MTSVGVLTDFNISETSNRSIICLNRAAFYDDIVSICIFTKLVNCAGVASGMNNVENAFTNGLSALPQPALIRPKMVSSSMSPCAASRTARPFAYPPYKTNPLIRLGYPWAKRIATGTACDAAKIGNRSKLLASATAFRSSAKTSKFAPSRSREDKPVPL